LRRIQDWRIAGRLLFLHPYFTLAALVSLGLGIGGNTALFTAVKAQLFTYPPHLEQPDRLVMVFRHRRNTTYGDFNYPLFKSLAPKTENLAQNALFSHGVPLAWQRGDQTGSASVSLVSESFFDIVQTDATMGRVLEPGDFHANQPGVLLSHEFWADHCDSDPEILGKSLVLNGQAFLITGVTKPGFRGISQSDRFDLWAPLTAYNIKPGWERMDLAAHPEVNWLNWVAKLEPGVTPRDLNDSLQHHAASIGADSGQQPLPIQIEVLPLAQAMPYPGLRRQIQRVLGIVWAMIALIHLIACVNVAHLLLARNLGRSHEVATRLALGASRRRIAAQFFGENLLLALLAGALGLLFAYWAMPILTGIRALFPRMSESVSMGPDLSVLAFTGGMSLLTALIFGILPAIWHSRKVHFAVLRAQGPGSSPTPFQGVTHQVLLVLQISLSLVLVFAALLAIRSLHHSRQVDLVLDRDLVFVHLDRTTNPNDYGGMSALMNQMANRFSSLPPVASLAFSNHLPLTETGTTQDLTAMRGKRGKTEVQSVETIAVSSNYFETCGIPFLRGRSFQANLERGVIVNEALAMTLWGSTEVIGETLNLEPGVSTPTPVTGVVANSKYRHPFEAETHAIYLPMSQAFPGTLNLVVKPQTSRQALEVALAQRIRETAGQGPRMTMISVQSLLQKASEPLRITAQVFIIFGILALALAALGLYGILTYAIRQQMREIGIRIALGAHGNHIARLVLIRSLKGTMIGLVLGIVLAPIVGTKMSVLLFNTPANDPLAISLATLILGLVIWLSSTIPVYRATRVDPMTVLRYE